MARVAPVAAIILTAGCQTVHAPVAAVPEGYADLAECEPVYWAEVVPGVQTRLPQTDVPCVALTLDACGSTNDAYDAVIIDYLRAHKLPATLFINARWIAKNPERFAELAADDLFEIGNHGLAHKPCSVTGQSVYGIAGTGSIAEVLEELDGGAQAIEAVTGKTPAYFRSGTAYYDEIAVEVIRRRGAKVAGFSVLGDAGTTYNALQVFQAVSAAQAGDIIICHFNHPERETAEGLLPALEVLRKKGLRFVRLSDIPDTAAATAPEK